MPGAISDSIIVLARMLLSAADFGATHTFMAIIFGLLITDILLCVCNLSLLLVFLWLGHPQKRSRLEKRVGVSACFANADTPTRRHASPAGPFLTQPSGRGRLAVFPSGGRRTRSTRMNPDMGALLPVRLGPPRETAN